MRAAAVAAAAAALLAACSTGSGIGEVPVPDPTASAAGSSPTAPLEDSATAPTERRAPHLRVEVVTDELEHGWDVGFLPDGRVLVAERPARLTLLSSGRAGATVTRVRADLGDVYVQGEGGLLGLVLHPDFAPHGSSPPAWTTRRRHAGRHPPGDVAAVTRREIGRAGARADHRGCR
ncbi:MAG: PQQ-dependent sugar dehydrogenase [Nocardioides sp.]